MEITLKFDANELPALLAQLLKLAGNDVSAIAAAAMSAATSSYPSDAPGTSETPPNSSDSPAPTAEAKRRGRKPAATLPENVAPITSAEIAPVAPALVAAPAVTAPAAQTLPAAASTVPPTVAATPAPQQAAGSSDITLDTLRAAYLEAEERGATGDDVLALLKSFGVGKVSLIPQDRWAEALAKFNKLARV